MNDIPLDRSSIRKMEILAQLAAIGAIAIGGLVMMGWFFHIPAITSLAPGWATMKFNTALSVVLTGTALLELKRKPRIAQAAALAAALLGLLTLCEYLFGWNLNIDQLIVSDPDTSPDSYPGRMSFVTALNFFLFGSALLLTPTRYYRLAHPPTIIGGILSLLAVLGYIYGPESLYRISWFSSIAFHTAFTFVALALAILVVYPGWGLAGVFRLSSTGGYMARQLIPVITVIPILAGWLRWQGEMGGLFGTAFGLALNALANIIILSLVIVRISYMLHRIDVERQNALAALGKIRDELEARVAERTSELAQANRTLEQEVAQRKYAEERFRALLESAPDAVVIVDENARIVLSNRQTEKLFGYTSAELLQQPIELLIPESIRDHHTGHRADYIARAQHANGLMSGLDLYALRKDGSQIPVEISLSQVTTPEGVLVFSSIRDVTRRKRAEQEARMLHLALDHVEEGAQIIDFDWKYLYVNDTAARQALRPKEELIGQTMMEVFPGIDQTPLFDVLRRCMKERVSEHVENLFTFPDNTTGWFDLSIQPVTEGIFILSTEITERKQADDALRKQEELLQTIFRVLPVGISLINPERQIVQTNLALKNILGMSDDIFDRKYTTRTYIHPDNRPMRPAEFPGERAFAEQKTISDVEIGIVKENGGIVWANVSAAPLPDGQGVVTVTTDISERKRAVEALRNSEAQFRATFDYAAIGIAIASLEGRWLKVNQALCDIVGYTEQELLALTFQELTHPADLESDLDNARQLLADEIQSYYMEKRYFHKGGHIVWVMLSVSLVRDSAGSPVHFVSQIQNITDRKQAEETLRTRMAEEKDFQNRLKALHEISIELTAINDLDEFYRRAVELGLERLGYERLGLLLYDKEQHRAHGTYGTDLQGYIVPEHHIRFDPADMTGILARALNEQSRFVVEEDKLLFYDGKPIGEGWNAVTLLWNGTESVGWLAADNAFKHTPVTKSMLDTLFLYALTLGSMIAQKQTRIALAANEALLRTILDILPVGVWIIDAKGNISQGNPMAQEIWGGARYVGIDQYEEYKGWWVDTGEPIQAKEWGAARAIAQGETSLLEEVEIESFDGAHKYIVYSAVPMYDDQGNITGVVVVNQDISRIKETEIALQKTNEQLQEANEEVQRFAYIVSHDLRGPLINLRGFSDMLKTSVDQMSQVCGTIALNLDEAQREIWQTTTQDKIPTALRFIDTSVDRMDRFTSAMLNLSRLGRHQLTYRAVVVKEVVQQILQSLAAQIEKQGIAVTLGDLPNVEADRVALDQIFGNIITNAVRYLDPNRAGQIHIYGEQDDLQTTFHIQDNGRGIAESSYDKVFAPFRRGISDVEGEGMGLAYVQSLVRRHKGRIWFESTPDVGTTFSFMIPNRGESTGDSV